MSLQINRAAKSMHSARDRIEDERSWPSDSRARQHHYYEEECDPEFEITRPHKCGRLYQFLIDLKFQTGINILDLELAGSSVLEVCCGSGMMSEKFARSGAIVTGSDFSAAAILRARERAGRYQFSARFLVADAENLAFPDHSFDIVAVHDGLHHLRNPERAIREMTRVANKAVLIMDPARAALTTLAVKLGIAEEVEDAGNEVKRLDPQDVAKIVKAGGFEDVRWQRTLMYYPHEPGQFFRAFDNPLAFFLFRSLFNISNVVFGRAGNKLTLVAKVDRSL